MVITTCHLKCYDPSIAPWTYTLIITWPKFHIDDDKDIMSVPWVMITTKKYPAISCLLFPCGVLLPTNNMFQVRFFFLLKRSFISLLFPELRPEASCLSYVVWEGLFFVCVWLVCDYSLLLQNRLLTGDGPTNQRDWLNVLFRFGKYVLQFLSESLQPSVTPNTFLFRDQNLLHVIPETSVPGEWPHCSNSMATICYMAFLFKTV